MSKCMLCNAELLNEQCEHCDCSKYLNAATNKEKIEKGFNLLNSQNFFEAQNIFTDFIFENKENPIGYWMLLLAKYGINFVTLKKKVVPQIFLLSENSILKDSDYENALKYSDEKLNTYIREQAQTFEQVRLTMLEKSNFQSEFDVMIVHNNSTQNEKIWAYADDLYKKLTKKGLKVLYMEESFYNNFKENLEPFVYTAIETSTSMVVLADKTEDLEPVDAKNQWFRYVKEIRKNHKLKESLILIHDGEIEIKNSDFEVGKKISIDTEVDEVCKVCQDLKSSSKSLLVDEISFKEDLEEQFETKDVVLCQRIFKYIKYFSLGVLALWLIMYTFFAIPHVLDVILLMSLGILCLTMLGLKIYIFYKKKFNHLGFIFCQLIIILLLTFLSFFNAFSLTFSKFDYSGIYRSRRYIYYSAEGSASLVGIDTRFSILPKFMSTNKKIGGAELTKIARNAMIEKDKVDIYSFVIPNTVTSLEKNAFRLVNTIAEIIIPESVEEIDENVFFGWTNKQKIFIDVVHNFDSVEEIDESKYTRVIPYEWNKDTSWKYGCKAYIYIRNVVCVNGKEYKVVNLRNSQCMYYYDNRYTDFVDFEE